MSILILGGKGFLGRALHASLRRSRPDTNIIPLSSSNVDLTDQYETSLAFKLIGPKEIWHCAGLVGGIGANMNRNYDFLMQNSFMALNAIQAARDNNVPKFYYVSSSCAYPKDCPQPMHESMLGTGALEPTNIGYATAKLLGMEACKQLRDPQFFDYRTFVPCNLYGTHDHYGENGHVLAALVRKICDAKKAGAGYIEIWGDGTARREFLNVEDAADAMVLAANNLDTDVVNIGSGEDMTIMELAVTVASVAGWDGEIRTDTSKPNGMMQKLLDIHQLNTLQWKPSIPLEEGIKNMIEFYNEIA